MTRFSTTKKRSIDSVTHEEIARMAATKSKYRNGLILFDHHIPYEHEEATKIALAYAQDTKPEYIILGGDVFDNPEMGLFPIETDHETTTQTEIDRAIEMVERLREASPKAEVVWLYGNHDKDRFERRKKDNPKGLGSLRNLRFERVIRNSAEDLGYNWKDVAFKKEWQLGDTLYLTHGDPRSDPKIKGGVTGPRRTAEMHPFSGNIVYGHIHKANMTGHPFKSSKLYTAPCLLDPTQSSYVHYSKYDVGFMTFKYSPNSRPEPVIHLATHLMQPNGDMVIDGMVYNGRTNKRSSRKKKR